MVRILVVVDMQNDFIDGALGTREAEEIVSKVAQKVVEYKKQHDMIMVTRDTHGKDYLNTTEGRHLPVEHCIEGTAGWELTKELSLGAECQYYNKETFGSVALAEALVKIQKVTPIEEIELIGLCTDICVISNALLIKSFLPEVTITVDAGCCAGVTPESHRNALAAMQMCHIHIVN